MAFAGVFETTYPRLPQSTDRDALVSLYNATDGQTWRINTNWLADNALSTWHGVTVTNGRVTSINVEGNNLSGKIPPELGNLSLLTHLYLASNRLTGRIPIELTNLTKLSRLFIGRSQLTGTVPPEIGNLTNLRILVFHYSSLSGPLPQSMSRLTQLDQFWFEGSDLCAPVDETLRTWLQGIRFLRGRYCDSTASSEE